MDNAEHNPQTQYTTWGNTHANRRSGAHSSPPSDITSVRVVASWYWNHMHWTVLPAYVPRWPATSDDAICSCAAGKKCDKPGKHPIGLWGDIEHDAAAAARWFADFVPWAVNVSLLTGQRSGVVVGDTDPRHGGRLETLWELGWSPDTVIARTGGGGWHVLAQCPPGGLPSVDAYAEGIEFKADGKQVILPPSRHSSDRTARYRWLPGHAPWECAVAPLPASVIEAVRAERPVRSVHHSAAPLGPVPRLTAEELAGALRRAGTMIDQAVERAHIRADNGRHGTLLWLANRLVLTGVVDERLTRCLFEYQARVREGWPQ